MNVDLKAPNLPQPIISMVTKKIAGAILSLLMREAQRLSKEASPEPQPQPQPQPEPEPEPQP